MMLWISPSVQVCAQEQSPVLLSEGSIPGAVITGTRIFEDDMMLDYIPDDYDLYSEFVVQSLFMHKLILQDEELKVDVFRFRLPERAFGVYSLSTTGCIETDTLTPYDCFSATQYKAAYGHYFLTVTSESGTMAGRALMPVVASAVMKLNPEADYLLPEPFELPCFVRARKNLVYLMGPVGLGNSLFSWQDLFRGVHFGMFAITMPGPQSEINFARITFPAPADLGRFLESAGLMQNGVAIPNINTSDGLYREFRSIDASTIYFLESQQPYPIEALLQCREY
jgi:hypothetical protein